MVKLLPVSDFECDLIETIAEIGFGELMFVEVPDAVPSRNKNLTSKQEKLLKLVRDGNSFLENIKIHQGDPTQVTVLGETRGIKYRKKIQL